LGTDNWDQRFVGLAHTVAQWSKDPSVKVGAVIVNPKNRAVVSLGFNGFPRNVADNLTANGSRYERPVKYIYTEHAERNAIYNAARLGHSTEGCTLYLNWAPDNVCADCARAIIQAGISVVYGSTTQMRMSSAAPGSWHEGTVLAAAMLREAGVIATVVQGTKVGKDVHGRT